MYHDFHKNKAAHKFFFGASNENIRVISEGLCDTETWSNDAENSALPHRNKYILKYIQIGKTFF